MPIYYIDRKTGEKIQEVVASEKLLRWVFEAKSGNRLLEMLIKRKIFSTIYGKLQDFGFSKRKISSFVKDLNIDMREAQLEDIDEYKSFNDFFIRKLKESARTIVEDKNILTSPTDGRIFAYENIDITSLVQIKGFTYSLEELIHDKNLSLEYKGGICIVVRLNPSDYHRFHFPDGGVPLKSTHIKGSYYSVNPLALKQISKVYCQNKREVTVFKSDNFRDMLITEVGATCVGSIVQTYIPNNSVNRGEEKGYFKFGGSTVIMFLKKDTVKIDSDIIENTNKGYETKILMGERIGEKII